MFRGIKNKLLISAASAAIGFNVSGCPPKDTDTDRDGIYDEVDDCITQPETHNGYNDFDGCPDVIPDDVVPDNNIDNEIDPFTSSLENLLENPADATRRVDDLFSAIGEKYAKYGADRAMSSVEQDLASNIKTAGRMDKLEDVGRELSGKVFELPDTSLNKWVPQAINKPIVFYVNGITTTIPDYINQLYALRGALKELDIDVGVTGFYNESFSEVKINGVKICPFIRLAPFYNSLEALCAGDGLIVDLAEAGLQEAEVWGLYRPNLEQSIELYNVVTRAFNNRHKIIFLGHSQGNLFIRQTITFLGGSNKDDYRVVSVGTPALVSHPAGGDAVETVQISGDIMNYVPGSPFSNTPPSLSGGHPFKSHSFIHSYLKPGSESRHKILASIERFALELVQEGGYTPGEDAGGDRYVDAIGSLFDKDLDRLIDNPAFGFGAPDGKYTTVRIPSGNSISSDISYLFTDNVPKNGPGDDIFVHFGPYVDGGGFIVEFVVSDNSFSSFLTYKIIEQRDIDIAPDRKIGIDIGDARMTPRKLEVGLNLFGSFDTTYSEITIDAIESKYNE